MIWAGPIWEGLVGPFIEFGFLRRALVGCLALSLSAPPLGVFLMLRRMSLTGDVLAHGILPGVALGFLLAGLSVPAMALGGWWPAWASPSGRGPSPARRAGGRMRRWPRSTWPRWRWGW
ncbi:metal ABC transporter permease [Roseococcus microcysteis]